MKKLFAIFLFISLFSFQESTAQNSKEVEEKAAAYFTVRGEIRGEINRTPVEDATVRVVGGEVVKTNAFGRFTIRTRIGDQLVIEHPSFGKEFHTVTSGESIEVLVKGYDEETDNQDRKKSENKRESDLKQHKILLDSAVMFKKKDIDKSIQYIEKALENLYDNRDEKQLSDSYSVLGDIYVYWKQYDLAISNYEIALKMYSTSRLWISLGLTQLLNEQYQEAITSFNRILRNNLSRYQQATVYEGLGDAYNALKKYEKALENYNKGLEIAKEDLITPKITDLNSKIAENYAESGKIQIANNYYNNSLNLASEQNLNRAIVEQDRVADFYNSTNLYDKEIELRKKNLEDLEKSGVQTQTSKGFLKDSVVISSQRINYKIGNAFLQQQKYDEALPYFEKSASEANKKEDLIVQKDATRKLSETLESLGDFDAARKTFEEYVELVNELVLRKEQEISQANRFRKNIQDNQIRIMSLEADRTLENDRKRIYMREQLLIEESNKRQQYTIYSLIFGMTLLVITIYLLYRNSKQQKLANNLLALKSLRTQMNPHFIFNALNSVNNYIALNDERNANRYLSEFSTLMRSVLENSDEDFIPLSKELELLELYVRLEHMRFQDKFDYEINVDEQLKVSEFQIPPMLLQPYIENAIWHGLRYKEEKGKLRISISAKNDETLEICIEDDGIGRKRSMELKTKNQLRQKSKGMGNIKKRIAILNDMYKDKVDVTIADVSKDGQGTKVILTLKKD
ncbi:tetratricopeptide repeat protein [Kordia algicida OT-1]|uniref:Possible sensor protein n=1 Tax=Kordia algicida OT-1 TaxID=391587 RepID=A9DPK6_9FLAO|nr:tetratricopeptide repeat protein [Kordia algicida]EDP97458.1 possible sensor protein [Kordia algicida OT-1]